MCSTGIMNTHDFLEMRLLRAPVQEWTTRKEDRHKEDFYLALTSEGSEQLKSMFMANS